MTKMIILMVLGVVSLIISAFSFMEKGFLFNNAYIFASKEERAKMDKKPYYRQSAITFLFLGLVFVLLAIYLWVHQQWIYYAAGAVIAVMAIYAISSSVRGEMRRRK